MKLGNAITRVELSMEESQNRRDRRVEDLWQKLDPQGHRELDLKGLQRGFKRIDHPLKNADEMLKQILHAVDTNGDGKIQYEEFRVFVETAERQLLMLFRSIDRDSNGRLDKEELQEAFRRIGCTLPSRRLAKFFDELDQNHDGFISFDEWRDFLLFMPTHHQDSALMAAWSFYSSTITVNSEGDSQVSDQTLQSLGPTSNINIPMSTAYVLVMHRIQAKRLTADLFHLPATTTIPAASERGESSDNETYCMAASRCSAPEMASATGAEGDTGPVALALQPNSHGPSQGSSHDRQQDRDSNQAAGQDAQLEERAGQRNNTGLTDLMPDPGYFLAGAVSGAVSRTATAPLDRLKVFLLVNTKSRPPEAVNAAKQGKPVVAVKNAGGPILSAIKGLYKAGGLRTFFAGNGLNVVKIMPEASIRFGSYEASKRFLARYEGHGDPAQISNISKFFAGGLGGMAAQFCVYPIDTLKFRFQCETVEGGLKGNALLMQTAKAMWADGGLRAAYRGLGLGLIGMFPYSAIDIGTFEFLKKSLARYKAGYYGIHEEDAAPGNLMTAVLGATSGALGATAVYPLNVLRTRLQTQGTTMHPPTYTGIWDVLQRTVRNEGAAGLYKGLTPNLLKVAPALSITWVAYENMKRLLALS